MLKNQFVALDVSATTAAVIPAVAGKRILVLGFWGVNGVATAQSLQFNSGATLLTGVQGLPSSIGGGLVVMSGASDEGLFFTPVGGALGVTLGASTQVGGGIIYQYIGG